MPSCSFAVDTDAGIHIYPFKFHKDSPMKETFVNYEGLLVNILAAAEKIR